jgi:2'-5' RNA ligase
VTSSREVQFAGGTGYALDARQPCALKRGSKPIDSIELLSGEQSDELIRRDWALLQEAGLPSQARHTAASNRPHITLLAAPRIPAGHEDVLGALAGALPLPIHTAGLIIFRTGRGLVLARLGVVSGALLELHRMVHSALREVPDIAGNCVPNRWVPHITLARGMSPAQVAQATELLPGDHGQLLLTTLRRWDSHEKTTTPLGSR